MSTPITSSPSPRRRIPRKYGWFAIAVIIVLILASISVFLILQLSHPQRKADITVDFGSRQNHSHPIHIQFGIAGQGFLSVIDSVSQYLAPADLTLESYIVQMENIFTNPSSLTNPAKQDWSTLNAVLSKVQTSLGAQPLLTLQGTPAWLQPQNQTPPSPNYCLTDPKRTAYPFHAFPTHRTAKGDDGLSLYSQMPALIVAHIDKYFPNIHPNYELWNEPDGYNSWCASQFNSQFDSTRFNWYKAIFVASAASMTAQAQKDHVQISIGGPTITHNRIDIWMPKVLNDPQMAPYIDFVTYHQYAVGQTWDDARHSTKSVIGSTQDPQVGYAALYEKVSKYVRQGKQPNAQATPIYISEFNCPDVCRYSTTYYPLWSSLMFADLLNSVLDTHSQTGAASSVPAGIAFWAWSSKKYCMFGKLDAALDCALDSNAQQPYPPYYSYLLLGGNRYLGLANGGYVANTAATTQKGLIVTGFYTNTKDNILVVNTTGQSYPQLNILVTSPGSVKTTASYYILNSANPHIGTQKVDLSSANNGYIASVSVPAYSTVALSLDMSS